MEGFNSLFFGIIHGLSGHNVFLDYAGIIAARYLPYFLFLGFLLIVLYENGWRRKIFFLIEAALAVIISRGLITEIVRFFYYSPRPFEAFHFQPLIPESGSSVPSGHAAFLFALSMAIYFYDKRWGIYYFGLSLLVSLARIFAGVHWPTDIIAGAIVGIASGLVVHHFLAGHLKKLEMREHSAAIKEENGAMAGGN